MEDQEPIKKSHGPVHVARTSNVNLYIYFKTPVRLTVLAQWDSGAVAAAAVIVVRVHLEAPVGLTVLAQCPVHLEAPVR